MQLASFIDQYGGWIGLMLGAIAAVITPILARRTGKETVEVNDKDVATRAAAMALEALTEGLSELRTELGLGKSKIDELEATVEQQSVTVAEQGATIRILVDERGQMVKHMRILESLIPVPPGAPIRPDWLNSIE